MNGIVITGNSKGTLDGCEVVGHRETYPAVVIRGRCTTQLWRCPGPRLGVHGGIDRGRGPGPLLHGCEIFDTVKAGVEIGEGSIADLKECIVRNGQTSGVLVRGKSKGLVEECHIHSNAHAGVTIQEGGNPEIKNCVISGNGYEAVRIMAGEVPATVTRCDLSGNEHGAWDIAAGCLVRRPARSRRRTGIP